MYGIRLQRTDPHLDAADLEALIGLWLEEIDRTTQPHTAAGYRQKIDHFVIWWRESGPGLGWRLTRRDLENFGRHLAGTPTRRTSRPPSYHQQNDVLRRLGQMFKWAKEQGYIDADIAEWIPAPLGEPPTRKAPTLDDLDRLMQAAGESSTPIRDRALLAFLIGTGARRAEAGTVRIEAIQFSADGSGIVAVIGKRTRANKSGRHEIAFDGHAGAYLIALLDHEARTAGPLFAGPSGDPLTPQSIYKVVKKAIRRAGLESRITGPHDLRRAFATHLARHAAADGTIAADLLRRQLGHASYSMTAHYSLIEAGDIRQVLSSPLAMMEARPPK